MTDKYTLAPGDIYNCSIRSDYDIEPISFDFESAAPPYENRCVRCVNCDCDRCQSCGCYDCVNKTKEETL